MTKKIWKYPLDMITDEFTLEMPEGAILLSFKVQKGVPTLWALVNPDNKFEKRYFRLVGTGHSIEDDNLKYIDSVHLNQGNLIFHLFEAIKIKKV